MEELNPSAIFYFKVTWLVGITISCITFLTEIGLLVLIPRCRKFDEKVLTHMTATRIVNTVCEYYFLNDPPHDTDTDKILLDVCLVTGFSTDFVLVSWMFVFTKNMYDKVVAVFILDKWNFITITLIIWIVSLPVGFIFLIIVKLNINVLIYYFRTYYCIKFIILIVNALFFVRIMFVAKNKGKNNTSRNLKDIIRTSAVAFTLVLANVLQVLSTDLVVVFHGNSKILTMSSGVLNSFHAIPIMIIFILLLRAKIRSSVLRHVSLKLSRL